MSKQHSDTLDAEIARLREENERRSKEIRDEAAALRKRFRRALAGPKKRFTVT